MKFRTRNYRKNGEGKQIGGGTLKDEGDQAKTNFVSHYEADYYAKLYQKDGLSGGHIILLNAPSSEYYEKTRMQAMMALKAYPGGLQVGGGITAGNACEYLEAGASHVIVTSYVFCDGEIHRDRLQKLVKTAGKDRIVLDLSCRKKKDGTCCS